MQCATHKGKESIGYCKKCGKLGCTECLVKVEHRGQIGQQSSPVEILVCRECLARIRPDLSLPGGKKSSKKSGQTVRTADGRKSKSVKLAVIAAASAGIVLLAAGGAVFLPHVNVSQHLMSPDEVALSALSALSTGNRADFLSCVDIREFMSGMDSTGLTARDYREADGKRAKELEESHGDLLISDLFVKANLRKDFKIVAKDIRDESASLTVSPWVMCGKKMYKRITLTRRLGAWKISGLASPDY